MNRSFFLCLAACRMRPSARDTLSRFCAGTWFAGPHSLWPPPFAPPAPRPVARPCSPASQLLWYRLIPASILHRLWLLAFPMQTRALCCDWSDVGSPGSRATSFHTCQVLRPRRTVQALALTRLSVLPSSFATASAPGISIFARLNGWPVCSPTDASPPPSRATAHGSGPMWFATPSSRRTCTDYSLPVSRRTAKDSGHYLQLSALRSRVCRELYRVAYC